MGKTAREGGSSILLCIVLQWDVQQAHIGMKVSVIKKKSMLKFNSITCYQLPVTTEKHLWNDDSEVF